MPEEQVSVPIKDLAALAILHARLERARLAAEEKLEVERESKGEDGMVRPMGRSLIWSG